MKNNCFKQIKKLLIEIEKISQKKILNFEYEVLNDICIVGIKFKNFSNNTNKVKYSIELMNKLDNKLPDNFDIFII